MVDGAESPPAAKGKNASINALFAPSLPRCFTVYRRNGAARTTFHPSKAALTPRFRRTSRPNSPGNFSIPTTVEMSFLFMPELPQSAAAAQLATLLKAVRGEPGTLAWDGKHLTGTFNVDGKTYELRANALLTNLAPSTLEYDTIRDLTGDGELEVQLGPGHEILLTGGNGIRIKGAMGSSAWRMNAGSGCWSCVENKWRVKVQRLVLTVSAGVVLY
ncbi:hypothetical protein FRC10_003152 [Ceratobasidium sp. 414]|nr:hypothetical protein FRC10_003152 [Ceratobasidium sp. 414]